MRVRVLRLTASNWTSILNQRRFALIRVSSGGTGIPVTVAEGLNALRPEGMTFGVVDTLLRLPATFWLDAFQTRAGPMRRTGERVDDGYYLFRDGLIIANHAGGVHSSSSAVLRYLSENLIDRPQHEGTDGWVYEQRVEPGSGYRRHDQEPRSSAPPPPPRASAAPPDAYSVLGVSPDCSDQELRKAYKAALRDNHPDRVAHLSPALQAFALAQTQAIREAWETLKVTRGL